MSTKDYERAATELRAARLWMAIQRGRKPGEDPLVTIVRAELQLWMDDICFKFRTLHDAMIDAMRKDLMPITND